MSNIEGEGRNRKYFFVHTSPSIFDIPCSLFDILITKQKSLQHIVPQAQPNIANLQLHYLKLNLTPAPTPQLLRFSIPFFL
jgi:hypothetical protein